MGYYYCVYLLLFSYIGLQNFIEKVEIINVRLDFNKSDGIKKILRVAIERKVKRWTFGEKPKQN